VIKNLGKHMRDVGCFSGATILGDGKVAMILDVEAFL
jgi:two-component system chemotaxis sensor kinase CheA